MICLHDNPLLKKPPLKFEQADRAMFHRAVLQKKLRVVHDGNVLGNAISVLASKKSAKIEYVTIAFGGWLGVGCHRVSVKRSDLAYDDDRDEFVLLKLRHGLGEAN